MRLFQSYQTLDLNPYMLVIHFRVWVSDSFEVSVKHSHRWYLKDPLILEPVDFGLVDVPVKPVILDQSTLAEPVNLSQMVSRDGIMDLTSRNDEDP